ncbi:transcription termination/antitermination protein NusG [Corynebacterium marinum]|jgi:transcriptional antiterminator NusG|uniref:Transcription termination/antitermination protein NusG n=1 Tax=Corynebacterium marinum DSM 44953 TaxID=1224162 RepID=A0A0B6TTA0_9CORY|nr:transcription termination/antitermination protein NusG [Corynebacterium marinum]AJK67976.1 transcription antitermination protein NusG [Corynebacterium marinum DSM 44953]GGO11409.1 transcription termination/antitermination protein NusG [Corynebacterium marinum]
MSEEFASENLSENLSENPENAGAFDAAELLGDDTADLADEATAETTDDEAAVADVEAEVEPEEAPAELAEEPEVIEEDSLAAAAAALGDTTEEDTEAEYRRRVREYTRELKKLPGDWYIIQCYSGYENKVKTNLDMRAQTLEVEEYIYDVVVPIEQVIEIKDGKRKLVKRKLLPGYVLVRMEMNDKAWSVVRDTPGVTSFVGNEGNATVVKHRDVAKFLMPKEASVEGEAAAVTSEGEKVVAMPDEQSKPSLAMDFAVGEAVTILTGALASVSATISEIDPATGKIQALVSIFGRETPVELTSDQIEKIN